ncbi:MAG TPA: hypothetical protein VM889_06950 [Candidatus Thermoplasmatota archaeon]|nr:hypothetical protein [Candidatus Thermoplasmatota archaeon]
MADLIKGVEAELFWAHDWAPEHYVPLADVSEPGDRVEVLRGLVRASIARGEADDAERWTRTAIAAETAVPPDVAARQAALEVSRVALLEAETTEAQLAIVPDYLDRFRGEWHRGKEGLVWHACLAAVVLNLKEDRESSARLFEDLAGLLSARVAAGGLVWRETTQSAWYRAMVAWRASAHEDRARDAETRARSFGGPSGSMR